jgi:hypothetical protein
MDDYKVKNTPCFVGIFIYLLMLGMILLMGYGIYKVISGFLPLT